MKGCKISSNLFRWRVFWLVATKYHSPNHIFLLFLLLSHLSAIFLSNREGNVLKQEEGKVSPSLSMKKYYIRIPTNFSFLLINLETIKIDQSRRCENIMPMTYHESTVPRIIDMIDEHDRIKRLHSSWLSNTNVYPTTVPTPPPNLFQSTDGIIR